jgi:hypothetical protein
VLPDEYKTWAAGTTTATMTPLSSTTNDAKKENMDSLRLSKTGVLGISSRMGNLGIDSAPPAADQGQEDDDVAGALDWQKAAPKASLYVDRKRVPQLDGPSSEDSGNSAVSEPYPIGFAQMLDMIQRGVPIPGIKEIPDTVVRDPVRASLGLVPPNANC